MAYRKSHIAGGRVVDPAAHRRGGADRSKTVVLVADEAQAMAALAALDLPRPAAATSACSTAATRPGAPPACRWRRRPTIRADADCIDFLFFTAARHEGDAAAARAYLAWETGLIAQLDAQERGAFRIA